MKRQRRRLSDLYVRGIEVEIDDGTGDPVTVWLQKLNPIDRDTCLRRAQAAQARFMVEADDEDSELATAMYGQIRDTHEARATLVNYLIAEDVAKARERVAAERGTDEDTWGKDDYLNGLVDAWVGDDDQPGLAKAHAEDPEDPEAKRVLAEIERYEAEVNEIVQAEAERFRKDWVDVPDEVIWRKVSRKMLEAQAAEVFAQEFERQQLFFSVRDPDDHSQRYFATLAEFDDLHERVLGQLRKRYEKLMMEVPLGKSLAGNPDSSNKSESSPAEETSPDSGPQAASV